MASVFKRKGRWYLRFKDFAGRWTQQVSSALTKTQARRLADELERKAERERLRLEPTPIDSGLSLAELCEWWLGNRCPPASRYRERKRLECHVKNTALGRLPVRAVTAARLETHLHTMECEGSSPATLNRLRAILHIVFSRAIRSSKWTGPNPVSAVERRKVPRRIYVTLREEELPRVLAEVPPTWRDLFTVAIWTGMRKGELLGLRKADLDLDGRTILVARSYDRETTKGGHADVIPMAESIVPVLRRAAEESASELVFPDLNGKMRKHSSAKLEVILRRALVRAGLVDGWEHVCRRCKAHGNPYSELTADPAERRCPNCKMKLWPRALPRRIRFHDLRHSAATLMLRAGVDAHRVQRILRHSDLRTTTGVYAHLLVEDLRSAINSIAPKALPPEVPEAESKKLRNAAGVIPFAALVLHEMEKRSRERSDHERISNRAEQLEQRARRELNPRPSDSKNGNTNRADGRHCWILLACRPPGEIASENETPNYAAWGNAGAVKPSLATGPPSD